MKKNNQKTRVSNRSEKAKPNTPIPPNRTIDDSPATAQHENQGADLRDLVDAPGQVSLNAQNRSILAADEMHVQTQIPHRTERDQQGAAKQFEGTWPTSHGPRNSGPEQSTPDIAGYYPRAQDNAAPNGQSSEINSKSEGGRPADAKQKGKQSARQ